MPLAEVEEQGRPAVFKVQVHVEALQQRAAQLLRQALQVCLALRVPPPRVVCVVLALGIRHLQGVASVGRLLQELLNGFLRTDLAECVVPDVCRNRFRQLKFVCMLQKVQGCRAVEFLGHVGHAERVLEGPLGCIVCLTSFPGWHLRSTSRVSYICGVEVMTFLFDFVFCAWQPFHQYVPRPPQQTCDALQWTRYVHGSSMIR